MSMKACDRIVQGLWIGGSLSKMEILSIRSFLSNGHEYHLYTYEDLIGLPEGVVVKDANTILPRERIFKYQVDEFGKGGYSGFSNIFRYHLLRLRGGWWADMDVICLKPLDFISDYVIASSYEGQWGDCAINCVMKMPEQSELANYLCDKVDQMDPLKMKYAEAGPFLLQSAIKELDLTKYVVSHEVFCPFSWREIDLIVYRNNLHPLIIKLKVINRTIRGLFNSFYKPGRITKGTFAIHMWNEIWRRRQISKNETYNRHCLYERLAGMYLR